MTFTLEMVQQMVQFAISALGISSKSTKTSVWYLNFGASDHRTYSFDNLAHVKKHNGALQIHNAIRDK